MCLGLTAALGTALLHDPALACSRVLSHANGHTVVARTFDLYMSDNPRLVVYPRGITRQTEGGDNNRLRWTSRYGSVGVLSFGAGTSDGMNEKGLVANMLYLHGTQYEKRDSRPALSNVLWAQYLLDTSATVSEALAALEKVQVVSGRAGGREWPLHLSLSDACGDSAVVEFVKGGKVVHRGKDTVVMTNEPALDWQLKNLGKYRYFGGSEALPGDIDPASRFVRARAFLKTIPSAKTSSEALEQVYSIIKTVSVPRGAINTSVGLETEDNWPTVWTTLADSVNRVFFFQSADSPNLFWLDFSKIDFSKGAPVLFVPGNDITMNGEVSGKLTVLK